MTRGRRKVAGARLDQGGRDEHREAKRFERFLAAEGDLIRDLGRRIERVESQVGLSD
jgi:hypothetical protein